MQSVTRSASSSHGVLLFVFLLGVIFTVQQRRGSPSAYHTNAISKQGNDARERDATRIDTAPALSPEEAIEAEKQLMQEEDKLKEAIPTLVRRPVTRPRQSINNMSSGIYWAKGSWGRIVATSDGCWAYPTVEGFAVECKRKLLSAGNAGMRRVISIRLEHLASLSVVNARCLSCPVDTPPPSTAPSDGGIDRSRVRILRSLKSDSRPPRTGSSFLDSSADLDVGGAIRPVATSITAFAVNATTACLMSTMPSTFASTCVAMFDVKFRASQRSVKERVFSHRINSAGGVPAPEMCFVTIGDWGAPLDEMLQTAKVLVDVVRRRMVKFIISTGDNFYPTGVQALNDQQFLSTFEQPYSDVALQRIRWYITAGNHDQWGLPPQRDYGLEHPRWFFPSFHYNRSIPIFRDASKNSDDTIELAVLNTAGRDIPQQVEMLDQFFATVEERHGGYLVDASRHWRFVVNHEPLFSGGMHGTAPRGKLLRSSFQPYMQQNMVHAYYNGDDHFLEIHRANGTDYFTSGAGGGSARYITVEQMNDTAIFQLPPQATHRGFMLHCIEEGVMLTTLIDGLSGKVLFKHRTRYFVDPKDFLVEE